MITRFALFQGDILPGKTEEFRNAVLNELLPTWTIFPGAASVRVAFATEKDDHAPGCPLVLAVDYASQADLDKALASQERIDSRAATQRVLPGLFEGQIFHYITDAREFSCS